MNAAILLSGGKGLRIGADIPKQYISVGGKQIITYALEVLLCHSKMDCIVIVADKEWQNMILQEIENDTKKKIIFVLPGATRQFSIWNGLEVLKKMDGIEIVLIHDAARPNLTSQLVSECLNVLKKHEGVMPALPMKDTVYYSVDGCGISDKLNRNCLFAGQAPEAFWFEEYYRANEKLLPDQLGKITGSTEPAILAGMDVVMITGDEKNYKITTQEDLTRFKTEVEGALE